MIIPFKNKRAHTIAPRKRGTGKHITDREQHLKDVAEAVKKANTYDPDHNAIYQELVKELNNLS